MRPALLNLLTALSLLLCVAVVALWVRSYWVVDARLWMRDDAKTEAVWWVFYCGSGAAGVNRSVFEMPTADLQGFLRQLRGLETWHTSPAANNSWRSLLLPHVGVQQQVIGTRTLRTRSFRLPLWLPGLVTAVLPARRLVSRWRRRRRLSASLCPSCGYDLRATPGRCPECGTTATVSTPV